MTHGETVGFFIGGILIVLVTPFLGRRKSPTGLTLVLYGVAVAACLFMGIKTWGTQITLSVGAFLAAALYTLFIVPRIVERRREEERSIQPLTDPDKNANVDE